jgi:hypothetical protein
MRKFLFIFRLIFIVSIGMFMSVLSMHEGHWKHGIAWLLYVTIFFIALVREAAHNPEY